MNSTATRRHTTAPPQRLWWFVSLSLLLHLSLAAWVSLTPPATSMATASAPALAVRLQAPLPRPHQHSGALSPSRAQALKKETITPAPPAKAPGHTVHVATSAPAPESAPDSPPAPASLPEPPAPNPGASQEEVMAMLREAMAHHFVYPLLARRRGWEGEVVLGFRLENDGRVLDARVARSSGHGVLDRAALNALAKIRRIEYAAPQGMEIQLPVHYRLKEG